MAGMPSAVSIVLLALAVLAVTDALPAFPSPLINAKSSDATSSSPDDTSNVMPLSEGALWSYSVATNIATYALMMYCVISLCILVAMWINPLGAEEIAYRLFDCLSDCLSWPLRHPRRNVSFPHPSILCLHSLTGPESLKPPSATATATHICRCEHGHTGGEASCYPSISG